MGISQQQPTDETEMVSFRNQSADYGFTMIPNFVIWALDPYTYKLLSYYWMRVGKDGDQDWQESIKDIAAAVDFSENKVRQCNTALEKLNWLHIERVYDEQKQLHKRSVYTVMTKNVWDHHYLWWSIRKGFISQEGGTSPDAVPQIVKDVLHHMGTYNKNPSTKNQKRSASDFSGEKSSAGRGSKPKAKTTSSHSSDKEKDEPEPKRKTRTKTPSKASQGVPDDLSWRDVVGFVGDLWGENYGGRGSKIAKIICETAFDLLEKEQIDSRPTEQRLNWFIEWYKHENGDDCDLVKSEDKLPGWWVRFAKEELPMKEAAPESNDPDGIDTRYVNDW